MAETTLTRADLGEAVHHKLGFSRNECSTLVDSLLETIGEALVLGETVKISSFGTLAPRMKSERIGRNPKTKIEVPITPRCVLTFRPSHVLRKRINRK